MEPNRCCQGAGKEPLAPAHPWRAKPREPQKARFVLFLSSPKTAVPKGGDVDRDAAWAPSSQVPRCSRMGDALLPGDPQGCLQVSAGPRGLLPPGHGPTAASPAQGLASDDFTASSVIGFLLSSGRSAFYLIFFLLPKKGSLYVAG